MGYFETFKGNLENTAVFMGQKTKQAMDKTKVELQILNHKRHIQSKYKELGKVIYSIKMGTLEKKDEKMIDDICSEITTRKKYIQKLNQEEQEIEYRDNSTDLQSTSESVEGQINLFDVPKPEKNTEGLLLMKFCPECQIGNHPEATRCISCGTHFE